MRTLHTLFIYVVLTNSAIAASQSQNGASILQQARAAYRDGQFAESEKLFRVLLGSIGPAENKKVRAVVLAELGDVYVSLDEMSKGEHAYKESLAIYRQFAKENDPEGMDGVCILLRNLGAVYSLQRRHKDALRVLGEALKLTKDNDAHPAITAQVLNGLGIVYYRQDKIGKAEDFFNRALQLARMSDIKFDIAQVLNNLASVYHAKRDFQKSEDFFKQALERAEVELGPNHPELMHTLASMGAFYTNTKRYTEAEMSYQRILQILKPREAEFESRIARVLYWLSRSYMKAGKTAEAEAALEEASVIVRRNLMTHPDLAAILEDYSTVLKKRGLAGKAEEIRVEAKRARTAADLVINAHNPF